MARSPRRGRISPLPTEGIDENPDASQEVEDTEEPHEGEVTQPEGQEETTMADTVTDDEFTTFVEALDRFSMEQLIQVIDTAQERREAKQGEIRHSLLEQFREQAEAAGMSLDSFFPQQSGRRKSGARIAVKYRHPTDPALTWSGRGMKAAWLTQFEQQGRDIEEFRVKEPVGAL